MMSRPLYHVLLPVHPEYAWKLLSGEKRVEFRKTCFSRKVDRIIIYATAPVKKVVGTVGLLAEYALPVPELWKRYHKLGGISKRDFMKYYQGHKGGVAFRVCDPIKLAEPIDIKQELDPKFRAPQSFAYIPPCSLLARLLKKKGGKA